MDMESYAYESSLYTLLDEDKVDIEQIDDAVRRVSPLKISIRIV